MMEINETKSIHKDKRQFGRMPGGARRARYYNNEFHIAKFYAGGEMYIQYPARVVQYRINLIRKRFKDV